MENVSDKVCRENKKHPFYFHYFFPENRAVNDVMWDKNRMHCCVSTATVVARRRHIVTNTRLIFRIV